MYLNHIVTLAEVNISLLSFTHRLSFAASFDRTCQNYHTWLGRAVSIGRCMQIARMKNDTIFLNQIFLDQYYEIGVISVIDVCLCLSLTLINRL